MHACIHAYIHTYFCQVVCIHSYALSLNHTPCFSVYSPLSYFIIVYTSHTLGSWVKYTLFIFYWSSPLLRNKNQSQCKKKKSEPLYVVKPLFSSEQSYCWATFDWQSCGFLSVFPPLWWIKKVLGFLGNACRVWMIFLAIANPKLFPTDGVFDTDTQSHFIVFWAYLFLLLY